MIESERIDWTHYPDHEPFTCILFSIRPFHTINHQIWQQCTTYVVRGKVVVSNLLNPLDDIMQHMGLFADTPQWNSDAKLYVLSITPEGSLI
jgi:hypothetical protein